MITVRKGERERERERERENKRRGTEASLRASTSDAHALMHARMHTYTHTTDHQIHVCVYMHSTSVAGQGLIHFLIAWFIHVGHLSCVSNNDIVDYLFGSNSIFTQPFFRIEHIFWIILKSFCLENEEGKI
jgi:hypothetical protein